MMCRSLRTQCIAIAMIVISEFVHGCDNRRAEDATEADLISYALNNSASYRRLQELSKNASYVCDRVTPEHIEIAVGEDFPDHFHRWATLRIHKRTKTVERLEVDEKFEYLWVPDE